MKSQDQDMNTPKGVDFDDQTGYLLVRLDKDKYGFVDDALNFKDQTYQPKKELHITILSQDAADQVQKALNKMPARGRQISKLVQEADWSYRKFQRFYQVQDEQGNQSIIQMVEVGGLRQFFDHLNQIFETKLKPPPTHVTLYVHGDEEGIALPDQQTFDQRVVGEINPKVLQQQFSQARMQGGE